MESNWLKNYFCCGTRYDADELLNLMEKTYIKERDKKKNIEKVIFEKEYCIIIDNFGNRYISKPEKGEKYDPEKGFLVALAKYNGFSTTKIQKLIMDAVVKGSKKSKKVKNNDK